MFQIDHRIPMGGQSANALMQQAQQVQQNALRAPIQTARDFNALQAGQIGVENARMQHGQQQQAAISQALDNVMSLPEERRPQAYQMAVQQLQGLGIEIPEQHAQYDPQATPLLHRMTRLSGPERDEFTRDMSILNDPTTPPATRRALEVKYGLTPSASEVFEASNKPVPDNRTAIQKNYDAAVEQGYQGDIVQFMTETKRKGDAFQVTTPDGTTVSFGEAGGFGNTSKTTNAVQDSLFNAQEQLARLDEIDASIDNNPALQNIGSLEGMLKSQGLAWADWAGADLTEEQKIYLEQATEVKAQILSNLNATIKEITGAAMTQSEAARIGATVPGINDGPTVFNAKRKRLRKSIENSIARYTMFLRQGTVADWQALVAEANDPTTSNDRRAEITDELGGTLQEQRERMDRRFAELADMVDQGEITREQAAAAYKREFGI